MFGRKPKRLDARVRFQHQQFTRKLEEARQYKRQPASAPELPLKSRWSQAIALLAAAAMVYLVFVPNFLSAKNINIEGAGGDDANHVKAAVENYLNKAPFYLAQHNLVLLSEGRLGNDLLKDPKIYKVTAVKKSLFHRSVTVKVELKAQKYFVNRNGTILGVYNDGTVQEQLSVDAERWLELNPGTIKVKHDTSSYAPPNTKYFSDELIAFMEQLYSQLRSGDSSAIDYFAIPTLISAAPPPEEDAPATASAATATAPVTPVAPEPIDPPVVINEALPLRPDSLHAYVKKTGSNRGAASDIRVIFDTKQNIPQALAKLSLLFQQTPAERYARLYYIDLRFENRAFVCLVATPCANSNN